MSKMTRKQARKLADKYIPKGSANAISKEDLMQLIGATDRSLRQFISDIRLFVPIINLQNGKGFYEPQIENQADCIEAQMYLKQEEKRITALKRSIKSIKDFCKEI